jgi:cathepsin L
MKDVDPSNSQLRRGGGSTIDGAVASIVGFSSLLSNHYDSLLAAVGTLGPVVVNVAASGWGLYKGGIFDDESLENRDINHAVVLEGYGTDQETGQDYWLIRNSWGPFWGEDGYIRLKRVDPTTLDDPAIDCKMDVTPADGIACTKDDDGNDITPKAVLVCGTSGVLFDGVLPIGGHLVK